MLFNSGESLFAILAVALFGFFVTLHHLNEACQKAHSAFFGDAMTAWCLAKQANETAP